MRTASIPADRDVIHEYQIAGSHIDSAGTHGFISAGDGAAADKGQVSVLCDNVSVVYRIGLGKSAVDRVTVEVYRNADAGGSYQRDCERHILQHSDCLARFRRVQSHLDGGVKDLADGSLRLHDVGVKSHVPGHGVRGEVPFCLRLIAFRGIPALHRIIAGGSEFGFADQSVEADLLVLRRGTVTADVETDGIIRGGQDRFFSVRQPDRVFAVVAEEVGVVPFPIQPRCKNAGAEHGNADKGIAAEVLTDIDAPGAPQKDIAAVIPADLNLAHQIEGGNRRYKDTAGAAVICSIFGDNSNGILIKSRTVGADNHRPVGFAQSHGFR